MMTKEEKDLLLKYLCASLPYGVLCKTDNEVLQLRDVYIDGAVGNEGQLRLGKFKYGGIYKSIDKVKPYLRPIYSIEEKEIKQIYEKARPYIIKSIKESELEIPNRVIEITNDFMSSSVIIDELNKRHIDYMGFIEKGLALEALKDMYKL